MYYTLRQNNPRRQSHRWHCGQQGLTALGWDAISQVGGIWDDAETAHMEDREGRLREGACHPACLNFQLQVIVNDLRV